MFGDVGHGLVNALAGLLMIIFEKKLQNVHNDMFDLLFFGRYMIFIMSVFSVITGLIYNDFFALGFNCFGTKYYWTEQDGKYVARYDGYPDASPGSAFGIDAFWHWGENSMVFLNSYKMKVSVIVGVA